MKIKRTDANGVEVIVNVAADYVLQAGEQAVVEDAVPTQKTEEELRAEQEAAIATARTEEKNKHQATIAREKEGRQNLQEQHEELLARMAKMEEDRRTAELETMEPNERQVAQMREMETRLNVNEAAGKVREAGLQARLRATELAHYRERAMRAYGPAIFTEMVTGATEEEIDVSATAANAAYLQQRAQMRTEVAAELAASNPAAPVVPTVTVPNPAYVQQAVGDPQFPTPVQPEPVADANSTPLQLGDLTTENAVRTGQWGGEVRDQVLANLKRAGGQPPGNLGSNPRHMITAPPVHVQMPNGVTQPVGSPTGPVANPQMVQPAPGVPVAAPVAAPAVVQPVPGVVAPVAVAQTPAQAAAAAVARTHAGTNPAMAETPGAQGALAAAQATGQSPQQAFAGRFAPSPPVAAATVPVPGSQ